MEMRDAPAVAALIRTAFAAQFVTTDPAPSALRVTGAEIAAHLRTGGGAAADADGSVIGSVLWVEQDGGLYLSRLAVAPDWRGRGLRIRACALRRDDERQHECGTQRTRERAKTKADGHGVLQWLGNRSAESMRAASKHRAGFA